jgi:hypothetical protein
MHLPHDAIDDWRRNSWRRLDQCHAFGGPTTAPYLDAPAFSSFVPSRFRRRSNKAAGSAPSSSAPTPKFRILTRAVARRQTYHRLALAGVNSPPVEDPPRKALLERYLRLTAAHNGGHNPASRFAPVRIMRSTTGGVPGKRPEIHSSVASTPRNRLTPAGLFCGRGIRESASPVSEWDFRAGGVPGGVAVGDRLMGGVPVDQVEYADMFLVRCHSGDGPGHCNGLGKSSRG